MKPEYEKIQSRTGRSFVIKEVIRNNRPFLTQAWHYHPEIELCYTAKSSGKRYVGNNISIYNEGDLVLLGSNLPHGFTTTKKTEQIVIQFENDFLGKSFFSMYEMKRINAMLKKAKRGISFESSTKEEAIKLIRDLVQSEGMKRLINLLKLLDLLSNSSETKEICDESYSSNLNTIHLDRVKSLFQFVEDNFQKEISVEEISEALNLTPSAFYKFVKRHTNKKFTAILNEYRIDHASKLLSNTELSIADVCYQSGYNNLSYFNRKFKEIIHIQPSQFRDQYKRDK